MRVAGSCSWPQSPRTPAAANARNAPPRSLRPAWLDTSTARSMRYVDVILFTSKASVAAYAAYLNAVAAQSPTLRFYTVCGGRGLRVVVSAVC